MIRFPSRRAVAAGSLALGFTTIANAHAQSAGADSMSIGSPSAPLHLAEYASPACSHCAHFHATNWATLKTNYIDTGRVRLTLHEMLTAPPAVAFAMFQLARCANADGPEYFRRLGILFERQATILSSPTLGAAVAALVSAGAEWGLSEAQVMTGLNDNAGRERILRAIDEAEAQGVTSTPTFFLNGRRLENNFQLPDILTRTLDAAASR
ncbi:MAG: thioredoxin domain-containing protein [Hyphomonadaceae bacterium]|nr:thioredoxin domain-containing protein [Hyphomonadaceae bacterium]